VQLFLSTGATFFFFSARLACENTQKSAKKRAGRTILIKAALLLRWIGWIRVVPLAVGLSTAFVISAVELHIVCLSVAGQK